MENEIRNDELLEVEETMYEPEEDCEESNGIGGKILVGVGVVATGVVTTLVIKNRDKIKEKLEERKIAKLQKKGYVVYKIEDDENCEEGICEVENEEEK